MRDYSKRRKVVYDSFCGAFYMESLFEALERACETQRRYCDNNNRSEAVRLRVVYREIETTRHLYLMKKQREQKDQEKHHKINMAHLQVLKNLAMDRQRLQHCSNLGHYGPGTTRTNLLSRIEREITSNTKSARRRRETAQLLASLPVITECDRSLPTSELLKTRSHLRPPPTSECVMRARSTAEEPFVGRKRSSTKSATKVNLPKVIATGSRQTRSKRAQSCYGALLQEGSTFAQE